MMKNVSMILLMACVFVWTARDAVADDCGKEDRVSTPPCVGKWGGNSDLGVINNCDYPVTLKFDWRGPDARVTLQPGKEYTNNNYSIWTTTISCCPKYGRCR
jgi:hypothetical protein